MPTYYRLSPDSKLPLHWCYCDAWELDEYEGQCSVVDNRADGCQVWNYLSHVVAATIRHVDGDYSPAQGYDLLLLIDADRCYDGSGQWSSVRKSHVTAVRSVPVAAVHTWLESQGVDTSDAREVCKWIEANEAAANEWLIANARPEKIKWYESLPMPKSYKKFPLKAK